MPTILHINLNHKNNRSTSITSNKSIHFENHVFKVRYLNLCTDIQNVYVLLNNGFTLRHKTNFVD